VVSEKDFHYHLVLLEPLIPPNTGNAGRLSVATESTLHLIEPLGFSIDDKAVRRAGLDYWKYVDLHVHKDFSAWLTWFKEKEPEVPFYFIEDTQYATQSLFEKAFPKRAAFIFGKETTGVPPELLKQYPNQILNIPMFSPKIRSLNLSNSISIALYEAIRQNLGKSGLKKEG
jgi:tRNA (cytidine/uridine-2'-O-)-methyltransferase